MIVHIVELQIILLVAVMIKAQSVPQSPCPEIYQYAYDKYIGWSGIIAAPVPAQSWEIEIKIIMTINAHLPSQYPGKVELEEEKKIVWRKIRLGIREPIKYRVSFPLEWPLPEVENIILNGNIICSGNPGRYLTKIVLQHKFYPITKTMISPTINNPQDSGYFLFQSDGEVSQSKPVNLISPSEGQLKWEMLTRTTTERPPRNDIPISSLPIQPELLYDDAANFPTKVFKTEHFSITEHECGRSITSTIPLITNGSPTKRGEWPWLAAIFKHSQWGLNFTCGGSLISSKVVVTAAHCIKFRSYDEAKADSILVFLGRHNLRQWLDPALQAREVESVHIHPDYNSEEIKNDIAVLILKKKVEYNQYVQPICLWRFTSDLYPFIGQLGAVVGWGQDEKSNGPTAEPRVVSMPIVSQEQCLRSDKEYVYFTSNATFCAGFQNGAGPCSGDSGGGFMMAFTENGRLRWYLKGIVSTALINRETKQCDTNKYFIFTDVAKFTDWVSSFVNA